MTNTPKPTLIALLSYVTQVKLSHNYSKMTYEVILVKNLYLLPILELRLLALWHCGRPW